jgi:hypothetical protein
MNSREIDVHIEELVLHGFARGTCREVAEALETELRALLVERGVPAGWQASPERIEAGPIRAGARMKSAATGEQIARAVYGGGAP